MPTITHIFKTYFPDTQGGLEEAIRQIGKYSIANGYKVNVVSISKNPAERTIDGIKCKSYRFSFGNDSMPVSVPLMLNFRQIIDETDIVQLHYPYPLGDFLLLLYNVKKPIIVTFHCEILNRPLIRMIYEPFARAILKHAAVIVPTSQNLVNSTPLLQKFKYKTKVINLWLDEHRFDVIKPVDSDFEKQVESYKNFALFVGVLRWYKGVDVLLDVAKKIKENIVIVGKGPLRVHLEKRIVDEGITNVYLTGHLNDDQVAYLFKSCKFTVLPSISPAEAFGQVLLESSYFSKPMITTELGTGTSYVNKHGETGFVVKPGSVEEMTEAMNVLFTENNILKKFGNNSYKRLRENFTADVQGDKYIEIYNQLLKN